MSDYESYEPDDIRLKLEDNPVHTFLYLTGTASALAQADAVVEHVEKYGVGPKNGYYSRQPDEIRKGQDGDARWYDIVIDNHVPQIYEQLEAIEGLDPVIFYCHCSLDVNIYTNDTEGKLCERRTDFGLPTDLDLEHIDYYPDLYDFASTEYE